ncbi:MAG: hypothetical protein ACE5HP_07890 [Gemmatimonadota bacterium]
MAALLPLSAALVAASLADGLTAAPWMTELLILVAVAQGIAAGLVLPRFWGSASERPPPEAAGDRPPRPTGAAPLPAPELVGRLTGAGGRFLLFLLCVGFGAVESHAVGTGLSRGAPPMTLSLLVPPVLIGAAALRAAIRLSSTEPTGP